MLTNKKQAQTYYEIDHKGNSYLSPKGGDFVAFGGFLMQKWEFWVLVDMEKKP